jgi:hypothetical protein
MLNDELLTYLFNSRDHSLRPLMREWLDGSRRFAAFVNTYRTKIHKKIQTTTDKSALLDLRLEFETAFLLLLERTLSLEYEPAPIGQVRGADFAVTYTTSSTLMLEVTRLRQSQSDVPIADRLSDAVCAKLGQLSTTHANVLLIGVESTDLTPETLRAAMLRLQQRAETSDPAVITRHKFRDPADFIRRFQRLSEILIRPSASSSTAPTSWLNLQAKTPIPPKFRTALHRTLSQPSSN